MIHIHPKVTQKPIKTFEPYSKKSEKCYLCKYCAPIQGRYPTPDQPLQPLKAQQKNTEDLLNRAGTQRLGCRKEEAVELQLLVPSDSKHWGVLVSHGQLLLGGSPRDNSGFHTEMPTEGH